ncbi:hypothetical protein ACSNOI_46715, partial [Actinomadura kijaniata]
MSKVRGLWEWFEDLYYDNDAIGAKVVLLVVFMVSCFGGCGGVAYLVSESDKRAHCGLIVAQDTETLWTKNGECVGVAPLTRPVDTGVFGRWLQPDLEQIRQENASLTRLDNYVTVAVLTALPTGTPKGNPGSDPGFQHARQQLQGAHAAQAAANRARGFPRIQLMVANMGADETHWRLATDTLAKMTGPPGTYDSPGHRLVAAVGIGLSRQESLHAARALATAKPRPIPMVADLTDADGFNATGAIDGRGPIGGLVRVAPTASDQFTALAAHLRRRPALKTATLVWTPTTAHGSPD